ncbi:helix-turn-helix transcriptional regulator [Serratia liquefaciens]|uniref:helix-turn-helix transcriptional regulator n=1 Tax=Serratia liquefaciens TaxID=614 RepID=UPI0021842FBD|nr:LuxR C-terminal-related transcriptional regulator [Serratia liquefaciens]CAI2535746.1 colanic acid capsular biosynthesis activation protein A [Serratia liquefaciens]
MTITIFSKCTYTTIGIKHFINQLQRETTMLAGRYSGRICFIDVTIENFEALYRAEYANSRTEKIVVITDCLHRAIIVDEKTIILSSVMPLCQMSDLFNDLYDNYSRYTELPQLSQRESLFLSEWSTGKSLVDISSTMKIRNKTANHYKSKIMKKFGASRIKPLLHIHKVRYLTDKLNISVNDG